MLMTGYTSTNRLGARPCMMPWLRKMLSFQRCLYRGVPLYSHTHTHTYTHNPTINGQYLHLVSQLEYPSHVHVHVRSVVLLRSRDVSSSQNWTGPGCWGASFKESQSGWRHWLQHGLPGEGGDYTGEEWGWGNGGGEQRRGDGDSARMIAAIGEINYNLISSHSGWHPGPSLRLPHSDWQEGHR